MLRSLNEDIKLLKPVETINTFSYVVIDHRNGDTRYVGNSMYGKIRKESNKKNRPTIQLDLDGDIINKWGGVTVTSKELRINRTRVCNDTGLTAGGFK